MVVWQCMTCDWWGSPSHRLVLSLPRIGLVCLLGIAPFSGHLVVYAAVWFEDAAGVRQLFGCMVRQCWAASVRTPGISLNFSFKLHDRWSVEPNHITFGWRSRKGQEICHLSLSNRSRFVPQQPSNLQVSCNCVTDIFVHWSCFPTQAIQFNHTVGKLWYTPVNSGCPSKMVVS